MKNFYLNFTEVRTVDDFYHTIINGLELPDWCGQGPDAILDCYAGTQGSVKIYIKGIELMRNLFYNEVKMIEQVFGIIEQNYNDGERSTKIIVL